jgi:hypothetical protein
MDSLRWSQSRRAHQYVVRRTLTSVFDRIRIARFLGFYRRALLPRKNGFSMNEEQTARINSRGFDGLRDASAE